MMRASSRPLVAALLLMLVEAILLPVATTERFLSAWEVAAYLLAAVSANLALVTVAWALGSAVVRSTNRRSALRDDARRPVALTAAVAAAVTVPLCGVVLWDISDGRTLRDVPGRIFWVALLAGVCGAAVGFAIGRLMWVVSRGHRRQAVAGSAGLAAVALVAMTVDATVLERLYPAFHVGLAALALCCVTVAVAAWPARGLRLGPLRPLVAVTLLCSIAVSPAALWLVRTEANAAFVAESGAVLTGKLIAGLRRSSPDRVLSATPDVQADRPSSAASGIDIRDRDILLITVDALRADRLAAYGGSGLTPHMDALARRSVVFRRAYTPSPTTSYALGSLMTGTFLRHSLELDPSTPLQTLAALLGRNGYRTAAFYPPAIFFVDTGRFSRLEHDAFGFEQHEEGFESGADRVAQLDRYLDGPREGPCFVWVHLLEPHEPYDPPNPTPTNATDRERYDAEVSAADEAVGRLVVTFHRHRPGGTVIVTADHGEEFGDHGGRFHGTTVYDEQVHVPLLWSSPGAAAPAVVDVPVEIVDVATTLLAAVGVPRVARMAGDDLGPVLAGSADAGPGYAFADIADERMATDGRFKLICRVGAMDCRLYDLVAEPGERHNLAGGEAAHVRRLRGAMAGWLASISRLEGGAGDDGWPEILRRARLGDPTAGPELVPLLGAPEPDVRAAAARALGRLAYASGLPVLRRLAESQAEQSGAVRHEAAMAAVALGARDQVATVREAVLAGRRPDASIEDRERGVRAALVLGKLGDGTGEAELLTLCSDATVDNELRGRAIEELGHLQSEAALDVLVPLLTDLTLRTAAAEALGRIGDRRARDPLARALAVEPYVTARTAEARALLRLRDRRTASLVRRWLGAPTPMPEGVDILLELGTLRRPSGSGADLRTATASRSGAWDCDESGCVPGQGAAVLLPASRAPADPAVAIVRVAGGADGGTLSMGASRRVLSPGLQEVAFELDVSRGARELAVSAVGDVRVVAIAVVSRQPS